MQTLSHRMIDHIPSASPPSPYTLGTSPCLHTSGVNGCTEAPGSPWGGSLYMHNCIRTHHICPCVCFICLAVPQSAGAEAQRVSGQQSVHPEGLQRRDHLQVSDQVPLGAREQGEQTPPRTHSDVDFVAACHKTTQRHP